MSSSDKEVSSPQLGTSSYKEHAPVGSKKGRKYRRPRVQWVRVLSIDKGVDAEMDDGQIKAQVLEAARAFMKAGKFSSGQVIRNVKPIVNCGSF